MYMYRRELIQIATVRTVHNKNEADDQRSNVAGSSLLMPEACMNFTGTNSVCCFLICYTGANSMSTLFHAEMALQKFANDHE